jgi:hypothetical protein
MIGYDTGIGSGVWWNECRTQIELRFKVAGNDFI